MYKLKIITSTTRPGRKGPAIAEWVMELAKEIPAFETELLDLQTIALPLMDEPGHPRFRKYQHDHTHRWSKTIDSADAFIIVTGEYNFGFPAPIKNALDFLFNEWGYKPVAFVSYGGISGGLRAVQMLKQVVTALSMMPITASVTLPFFSKMIDAENNFKPDETIKKSGLAMFKELEKWTTAMKPMRTSV